MWTSPTGTGKGTLQLALLQTLRADGVEAWILTPSLDVLRGYLERCGAGDLSRATTERLADLGAAIYVTTPVRARNDMLRGERGAPEVVIYDEVHHAITDNEVSGTLFAIAPDAVWLGFTATGFRASPRATAGLREDWGDPVPILSIRDAVQGGYQALPRFLMSPLIDDDAITVTGGEFAVRAAAKAVGSRIADLAALVAEHCGSAPTAVIVPSSDVAALLVEQLDERGIDAQWIHQGTPTTDRALAYAQCRERRLVLVTIKILTEGVDFPWLRTLVDARPTMSPVAWLQTIGRIMRPGETPPLYICACRNLERHAYLMQGLVPREAIAAAQDAFERPSKRQGARQIGLESLSRFRSIPLPLAGGLTGTMYCVYAVDAETGVKTDYVSLLSPAASGPLVARRTVLPIPYGEEYRTPACYGRYERCDLPLDLVGFATSTARAAASEKMQSWWRRDARRLGLDEHASMRVTRRQFQCLPVLANLGVAL
jgi:hypothetical protein